MLYQSTKGKNIIRLNHRYLYPGVLLAQNYPFGNKHLSPRDIENHWLEFSQWGKIVPA